MNKSIPTTHNTILHLRDIMIEITKYTSPSAMFNLFLLSRDINTIMQDIKILCVFKSWNSRSLDVERMIITAGSRLPSLIHMVIGKSIEKTKDFSASLFDSDEYTPSLLSTICYWDVCMNIDDFCQGMCNSKDVLEFLLFLECYDCVDEIVSVLVGLEKRPYHALTPDYDDYYIDLVHYELLLYVLEYHQSVYDQAQIQHTLTTMQEYIPLDVQQIVNENINLLLIDYQQRYGDLTPIEQEKANLITQGFERIRGITSE